MTREADDLERIIGRIPLVVFHWKATTGWAVEFVSLGIRRFGYGPEDFYSGRLSYVDLVHPEDRRRVISEVERHVARGDETIDLQYRIVGADGTVHWIDDHSSIRRDHGAVVGFEGVVLDVTERKSFELSELRHQHFEQVLLDALPMPVFFKDASLVYRGCNQAFASFVGVPREKIVDAGVHQLWPPELAALYDR
jgi:PAS domain S-box-containing protein